MARLWQNMLLADWKDIFAYVPLESLIKNYQSDYYKTINDCNNAGDCTKFIEFMLFNIFVYGLNRKYSYKKLTFLSQNWVSLKVYWCFIITILYYTQKRNI